MLQSWSSCLTKVMIDTNYIRYFANQLNYELLIIQFFLETVMNFLLSQELSLSQYLSLSLLHPFVFLLVVGSLLIVYIPYKGMNAVNLNLIGHHS